MMGNRFQSFEEFTSLASCGAGEQEREESFTEEFWA
jgi:hypothetical protein